MQKKYKEKKIKSINKNLFFLKFQVSQGSYNGLQTPGPQTQFTISATHTDSWDGKLMWWTDVTSDNCYSH